MERVGIYSGTFDPVHDGHISLCLESLRLEGLSRVIILPEPEPHQKADATPLDTRVTMIRQAIAGYGQIDVLAMGGGRFTVQETLPELQKRYEGHDLTFILGSDVVRTFAHRWPGLGTLLGAIPLIIGLREGDTAESIDVLLCELERDYDLTVNRSYVHSKYPTLTSSLVRSGDTMQTNISSGVARYIEQQNLYDR